MLAVTTRAREIAIVNGMETLPYEPRHAGAEPAGRLVAGRYRLGPLLGRGGMGPVYLARDLALDREVAIKVVKTDSSAREVHDRLRREARTAARLSHPNIVAVIDAGRIRDVDSPAALKLRYGADGPAAGLEDVFRYEG